MTGFAAAAGSCPGGQWSWELKTVNAKGLDLRLRLPAGFDAVEGEARKAIGTCLARGTCHATLTVSRPALPAAVRVNAEVLAALVQAVQALPPSPAIRPASMDGLLAIRGVVETFEPPPDVVAAEALRVAALAGLQQALDALAAMRGSEGAALLAVLTERLDRIGALTAAAEQAPQRQPAAVAEKLRRSVADLAGRLALDPDRLHQEALILAAKADIREELDRLAAHVAACRALLGSDAAVGRRLDFLAQELAREANTTCAKANDAALTAIGLELRVEIEQFREQVQNIE